MIGTRTNDHDARCLSITLWSRSRAILCKNPDGLGPGDLFGLIGPSSADVFLMNNFMFTSW